MLCSVILHCQHKNRVLLVYGHPISPKIVAPLREVAFVKRENKMDPITMMVTATKHIGRMNPGWYWRQWPIRQGGLCHNMTLYSETCLERPVMRDHLS